MIASILNSHPLMPALVGGLILLLAAACAYATAKYLLLILVSRYARRSRAAWDDALVQQNVFGRMAQALPGLIIQRGVSQLPDWPDSLVATVEHISTAYIILMLALTAAALLASANEIYEQRPQAANRPIKGFIQLAQLVVYAIAGILIIAALIDRSPLILLSGLGAITAILLIVFKDTLLSLAASIQLTSQQLIRVGDWLEVPQFGADGDVIDVALYSVTVQNWDKTITTIPTYQLVAGSFKNWRGMSESGGRRIKRSIYIDVNSIRFLTAEEIERFKNFQLLAEYIPAKQAELADYNSHLGQPQEAEINQRRLTNIGTLRAYIERYLHNHPSIHTDMTLIVRQLQPGPTGLPIEIYCFSNNTDWSAYEALQADIFDHICAIVPEFGLRLYQRPAGTDLNLTTEDNVSRAALAD